MLGEGFAIAPIDRDAFECGQVVNHFVERPGESFHGFYGLGRQFGGDAGEFFGQQGTHDKRGQAAGIESAMLCVCSTNRRNT